MNILEKIVETQKEKNKNRESTNNLYSRVTHEPRSDVREIQWDETNLNVISEIKRRSPSKGLLAEINAPDDLAITYEQGGAQLISVLTNEEFFGAKQDDLHRVRNAVSIPVLRKDFAVDLGDVFETYLMNADVILLIVAAFKDHGLLQEMHIAARELGLSAIVETHDEREIEIANNLDAEIIGVNVRSLETFEEDHELGKRLLSYVRKDAKRIWESSIKTISDAQTAVSSSAQGVLVGQGLVQHQNPQEFILQMRNIALQ